MKLIAIYLLVVMLVVACNPPSVPISNPVPPPELRVTSTMFDVPHGNYTIFQSGNTNCDYGSVACRDTGHYHTGIDSHGDKDIVASGPGFVVDIIANDKDCDESIKGNCDDHGLGNTVIVKHIRADDGMPIYTLYAHLASFDTKLAKDMCLEKGDPLGTMGSTGYGEEKRWGENPHLHFEFKTKPVLGDPRSNSYFGYVKNWAKDPYPDNWGYRDPKEFLRKVAALTCEALVSQAATPIQPTPTSAPTRTPPAPVPTPTLRVITTPTFTAISPLNSKDPSSVLQWVLYALKNGDINIFDQLTPREGLFYTNVSEGGKTVSKSEFLQDVTKRLLSHPQCEKYGISDGQLDGIWTYGWSPLWELDYTQYSGQKHAYDPPWTSNIAEFLLGIDEDGDYYLRAIYLNDPDKAIVYSITQYFPCNDLDPLKQLSATPASTQQSKTCNNESDFILDVTVPDGTHFRPGTPFVKTWRLLNSGNCAWDASYQFNFISGDPMNSPASVSIGRSILPGEIVDISVSFVAPITAGTYRSRWQMFTPDGTPFGTKPYVVIAVP